jgi:TPR repeat protein
VTKNHFESTKWYQRAFESFRKLAENNDARAMYKLGCMYERGIGVEKDESESVKWFKKAAPILTELAGQGIVSAQIDLAYLYEGGKGVGKDYSKALKLMRDAARKERAAKVLLLIMESTNKSE